MGNSTDKIHKDIGMLIACEGISGCGKSESIRELSRYLTSIGYSVHVVEWNSNKNIRNMVDFLHSKKLLTAFIYCVLQWISFLKDYFNLILPLLKKDCIVIADRYIFTGLTRDKVNGTTEIIGRLLLKLIRAPDMLFFFDTNPEICKKRIQMRNKELFHPNKYIHKNIFLKDKELYYLKKLRIEYVKCFDKLEAAGSTQVIRIINNNCRMNEFVRDYVEHKQYGMNESRFYRQEQCK
ncbi:MAG: thymidylate kinase [Eubacterium sp.]|nr:thymidylate kinase [Eubacterium sp.]